MENTYTEALLENRRLDPMQGPAEFRAALAAECPWLTEASRFAIEDAAALLRMREWDFEAETEGGYCRCPREVWDALCDARGNWAAVCARFSL